MNNKTILVFFTLLTLTTITTITLMVIYTINTVTKPVEVYYTININQHTDNYEYTYNITNDTPKVEVKTEKPKEEKKTDGYSDADIRLLAQLINAEAKGESFDGKVAVGNIVLNRVKSNKFPNTIRDVIYQPRQFQPVSNGAINNEPSEESVKAARESIKTNLIGDALYFYNPDIATDSWIRTRKVTKVIGDHSFAL